MARLVLTTADGQQVVDLQRTNSLGRHPSNSIQLLDKIVSKEHCIIEQRGQTFVLRDLGSLNGTYINRDRVHGEKELRHGDEIALGQTKARFEDAAPAYPPARAPAYSQQPVSSQQQAQQQWQQQQQAAPQQPSQRHVVWPQQGQQQAQQAQPGAYAHQQAQSRGASNAYLHHQQGRAYQQPSRPPPVPPPAAQGSQRPSQQGRPLPPPVPGRTAARQFNTSYLKAVHQQATVDTDDEARQIGAEIVATERDFLPYDDISTDTAQLRADYERLRLSYELTRDIAFEKDTSTLLEKILKSIFRFIPAQRGVIFLQDENGEMAPFASHRNDGGTGAITVSTTILRKVVEDRKAVLTHDAAMDFAASKGKSMILNQISSAIVAPMLHNEELFGVLWLDSKSLAQFQPKDLELVGAVANQAAMFIEINILGKQIQDEVVNRERLSRLLSPNVAERVISGQVDVRPGGARTECTVFNSDIRGFTRMSEHVPPEEIVEMLNSYFEQMVDVVFKYEGTLDKFMGDGIMALWGAPVSHPDDPQRAVECALEQTEVLGKFNRERMKADKLPLGVGFGVHTGPVVAGYIGSSKALSYTVIGDVANTSARLCAKALAGQIVVSEMTRSKLGSRFTVEELPPQRIRGKDNPIRMFNVVGRGALEQVPATVGPSTPKAQDAATPETTAPPGAAPPGE